MEKVRKTLTLFVIFIKKRWKLVAILTIFATITTFWWYRRAQANKTQLTFENPQLRDITQSLESSGVVDAKQKVRLRFLAGGKLTYLGSQQGDWVKKWQTIATIDQATLKKQLEQDLNIFMSERLDWDQTNQDLYQDGLYTRTDERTKEQGQLDLNNEVLDVEIRDIAITNTKLTAPFEGILTISPATTAGITLLSTDYFELVDPKTLVFKAQIDETDISQVKLGQKAIISLDAFPDEQIHTQVTHINYSSNETSTGTVFLVELPITAEDLNHYRLGMNGDVQIIIDQKQQVLTIPYIATKQRDEKILVDIKTTDQQTEEKEITTGLESDEYIEITSGLNQEDNVLIPE